MSILGSAKGEFVKVLLEKLTHGDTGSSLLGAVAAAVLVSGVDFGDLFSSDPNKQMAAMGAVAGAIVVGVWGWKIGKKQS